jgi:hypothetical protein
MPCIGLWSNREHSGAILLLTRSSRFSRQLHCFDEKNQTCIHLLSTNGHTGKAHWALPPVLPALFVSAGAPDCQSMRAIQSSR